MSVAALAPEPWKMDTGRLDKGLLDVNWGAKMETVVKAGLDASSWMLPRAPILNVRLGDKLDLLHAACEEAGDFQNGTYGGKCLRLLCFYCAPNINRWGPS